MQDWDWRESPIEKGVYCFCGRFLGPPGTSPPATGCGDPYCMAFLRDHPEFFSPVPARDRDCPICGTGRFFSYGGRFSPDDSPDGTTRACPPAEDQASDASSRRR